tara:strand:- start:13491 stop:13835 length:345 start_codon:yes stop_codon:yes gene_type:complete
MIKLIISLAIIMFYHASSAAEDIGTGLKIAPGWELVRTHCGACHSYKLVTTQRADKNGWLNMIRWMQETQNLWQFDTLTEQKILNYLANAYPPKVNLRRVPIPKNLMPMLKENI